MEKTAFRKYATWTRQEDELLAQILVESSGSLKAATRTAAARLNRSIEGTRTRARDLRQSATYYVKHSRNDNGVRVSGTPGNFSVRFSGPSSPALGAPTDLFSQVSRSSVEYTVRIRGIEVQGPREALRDILGLN